MAKAIKQKETVQPVTQPDQPPVFNHPIEEPKVVDVKEETPVEVPVDQPYIDASNTVDNKIENSPKIVADIKKAEDVVVASSGEETFLMKLLQIQNDGGFGHHLDDLIYERLKQIRK